MTKKPFHERCKFARERVGLSHQAAAEAIQCSRPTVYRWEVDARSISSPYLHAAARAYKVRPEWLSMDSDDDGYPWSPDVELAPSNIHRIAEPAASYSVTQFPDVRLSPEEQLLLDTYRRATGDQKAAFEALVKSYQPSIERPQKKGRPGALQRSIVDSMEEGPERNDVAAERDPHRRIQKQGNHRGS